MSYDDVKAKTTHRQFLCWMKFLADEWNRPSRSDNYLMQIAYEIARGNVKHPAKVKQKNFLMEFATETAGEKRHKKRKKKVTLAEYTSRSKAKWFSATGYKKDK